MADPTLDDNKLMQRFRDHSDRESFDRIVTKYLGPAKALAINILRDPNLANDAVQDTFLRIIEKKNQFDPQKKFTPWFYTILKNICRDMIRKTARDTKIQTHIPETTTNRSPAEPDADTLELLKKLPEAEQETLTLRFLHSMSFKEIAQAMECSEEAAKKRAQRGLKRLKEKWVKT